METTQRITDEYGKRIDDQRRKLQQTMDLLNEKQREAATNFQQFLQQGGTVVVLKVSAVSEKSWR